MAKIVISTVGTLGDILPFLSLGKALREGGHQVVLAVNSAFHPLVEHAGLTPHPCGPLFGLEQARQPPALPQGLDQPLLESKKWESILRDVPAKYRDLAAACAGADLLIAHSFHYAALLVHDRLRIPWVCVSLLPGQFQHSDCHPATQPAPRADLNLLASSPMFSQPRLEIYPDLAMSGFWFYDGAEQEDWQPDSRLREFVEQGDRPLVLCAGSLPTPDARSLVRTHVQAARQLGKKLVVQTGWVLPCDGGWLEGAEGEHVLLAEFLPHDWLFARAAAVIHHGGIGVTARALQHGCPTLVEPYRKDQYFHASRVRALGAGFAMDPAKLTVGGVARMLAEKVAAPETRECARTYAERVSGENGVETACRYIEECLGAQRKG